MARLLLTLFAFALMWSPALPSAAQSFNAQEQAEMRAIVRDYLVNNPEVLREALDSLEARTRAERRERIVNDERDFSVGAANAPITVVEFYDYRCPYCHAAMEWVSDLIRTRRDVRVVLKELPVLGDQSMEAARAALAAQPQNKYLAFHRALMSFQGDLTSARIDALARQSGIDVRRMRARMDDPEITRHLEQNRALAYDSGVNGTPAFFINNEWHSGFRDATEVEAALRAAGRAARAAR
ncbi:MAG: DsbA family protein [Terricaulis sp.]